MSGDHDFKAFSEDGVEELSPKANISRRMLHRLADIDNGLTPGPSTLDGRSALASSVVAHAVVELETQIIELRRQLAAAPE